MKLLGGVGSSMGFTPVVLCGPGHSGNAMAAAVTQNGKIQSCWQGVRPSVILTCQKVPARVVNVAKPVLINVF